MGVVLPMPLPEEPQRQEPVVNIVDTNTGRKFRVGVGIEQTRYAVLEISPSKLTSNDKVKWLLAEFARLYRPIEKRISLQGGRLMYHKQMTVWWEVFLHKGQIKFYLVVPDKNNIKHAMVRQVMKTWKQARVKEVNEYIPELDPARTDLTKLTLEHNSVLALDTMNPAYSPLDSLLNAKHYLKDDDMALLQIGMQPVGNGWNEGAKDVLNKLKKGHSLPRKKGTKLTTKELFTKVANGVGLIAEELMNLLGDFWIPGWEKETSFSELIKSQHGSHDSKSTAAKVRDDIFQGVINAVAVSSDAERRRSIVRSLTGGFDPLEGDNKLIEVPVTNAKAKAKELEKVTNREMSKMHKDYFGANELAKIIQVPDHKAQVEHYNELSLVQTGSEASVPREIFIDDGGIPFATYEDTDGIHKTVFFNAKNLDLLCKPRVIIGEPGSGKTTFATSFAVDAFNRGYGSMVIDAADGDLIQNILNCITPEQLPKVKIIDFLHPDYSVGLGWNEAFLGSNPDIVEDLLVEEVIAYIELVAGVELNMTARQWVENAVKAVFVTPDATLQDVENMINNGEYRSKVIPTITDPELRADWEYYHEKLDVKERKAIYDQIYRRMAQVVRKKTLKSIILQKPKKDANGEYLVDIRRWMDEGCLVLVKANETLGETLQTALVSFLIAKFNLAITSREDTPKDERKPCFLLLDEPDHYIKGSERWRNMLTRYRKYRCGLVFMFHGWQQLVEQDRNLPKIIRKSGPHYVIFQTDEDNLLELQPIVEPEFKVRDLAKGMPKYHGVIKLHTEGEAVTPAFMAKGILPAGMRYEQFDNNSMYELCAIELGRPKAEVLEEIYKSKLGADFGTEDVETTSDGETEVDEETELEMATEVVDEEYEAKVRRKIEYEVANFLDDIVSKGGDPNEEAELIIEMDRLFNGGDDK